MKENKSTIIGFVLMTLVFVGYMFYANFQAQKQQEQQTAAQIADLVQQYPACHCSQVEKNIYITGR